MGTERRKRVRERQTKTHRRDSEAIKGSDNRPLEYFVARSPGFTARAASRRTMELKI